MMLSMMFGRSSANKNMNRFANLLSHNMRSGAAKGLVLPVHSNRAYTDDNGNDGPSYNN